MMNDKKNARPDVAASERAKAEMVALAGTTFPKADFITPTPPGQGLHIADLLSHGQENAIPLKQLTALTELPERAVRRQIAAERKRGIMILADNKSGYFLPGTLEELKRFSRSMIHRASEIMLTARLAEDAYAEALGQGVMEGWTDG